MSNKKVPPQTTLASVSNKICLHTSLGHEQPQVTVKCASEILSVAWSHNSKFFIDLKCFVDLLLAICEKYYNQISFYKAATGELIQKFEVLPKGATVTDLQFSSNSRMIVFSGDDASFGLLNTMD